MIFFCFAYLRWCHDGWDWASNICWCGGYPPRLKYCIPIHYDTNEDGQNKISHLLCSFLVRIVLFLYFICGIYLSKISLHHFICFIWIITPLMKISVSIQEQKSSCSVCHRHAYRLRNSLNDTQCSHTLNKQLPLIT